MTSLADKAILSCANNRPPMLEKDMYDSRKSKMELYMLNIQHGKMILELVEHGPLLWPTVEEDGVTRLKKYSELSAAEAIQADCDVKETNIILQGLSLEVYALVSTHKVNTKFLNTLPPEWSKFVTDVKLAQQLKPKLYDGSVIKKSDAIVIPNTDETLMLAEESRLKMIEKQNDPKMTEKKVITKPIDYAIINQLEVQKELPKVSMGTWGFEHTKACFHDDIIPFMKALKELFTSFDQCLVDEVTEVQNVFKQMKLAIKQHLEEIETLNIELDHKVTKLVAENKHLKQTYKQLYDSIKSLCVRSKEQYDDLINKVNLKSAEVFDLNVSLQEKFLVMTALKEQLNKLKGKAIITEAVSLNPIDPELLKVKVSPLAPKLRKNRTAHTDYIRHTQGEDATLREIVESERLLNPLNTSLDYASNIDSNTLVLSSIRVILVSSASGSMSQDNTKKNRIRRTQRKAKKNKLEDHLRTVRYSLNKKSVVATSYVANSVSNVNSDLKCASCNGCLFSDNHDACIVAYINSVNASIKSKFVKTPVKRKVWQPTRNVFKTVGHIWKPTRRTFTLVGNVCPLTRIATPTIVPPREPIPIVNSTDKPVVTLVYSRKTKAVNKKVHVCNSTITKSLVANKMEPNNSWGSSSSNVPSSLIDCRKTKAVNKKVHVCNSMITKSLVANKMEPNNSWGSSSSNVPSSLIDCSLGPVLNEMTPGTISSGLVQPSSPLTSYVPPLRNDWDLLFQSMFDKLLNPLPSVVNQAPEAIAPIVEVIPPVNADSIGLPSSTTVEQDAPSTSNSPTPTETQSSVIPQDVGDDNLDMEENKATNKKVPVSNFTITKSLVANKMEPNNSWGSSSSNVPSSLIDCRLSKSSSGEFCDSNLEVAFRQHTCFIHNLDGVDLLTGSRGNNLYTLSLQDLMASSPICLLSKASKTKSWLWHRRLSHLNSGAINHLARQGLVRGLPKLKCEKDHLCSACAMGKSTKKTHKPKSEDINQEKLYLLHMDLCGPIRAASVNEKKYILVIFYDYSRFTWVKFLRSKDETPDFIIKFLKMIQVRLKIPVRRIQTDNGIEFVNQTLRDYYEEVGISHETSVARSPQQNGVVERRNHTLIKAARTMLIYAQAPLFLWAEAVATACKLQPKANIGIFIGYTPTKKAFRTIHVDFDELAEMASEQRSSGPALNEMTPGTISLGLV
nr:hypothetical protein [Tanacetum cinerariifolium]